MSKILWSGLPVRRWLSIGPPFLWLTLFLLLPFLLVLKISFADLKFGVPPYTPLAELKDQTVTLALSLRGYALLFTDSLYIATYLNSVKMAAVTTLCCALIGYPMAYYIARSHPSVRNLLLLGVILPFWTSLLLRVYAWVGILRNDGLLNNLLLWLGLILNSADLLTPLHDAVWGAVIGYMSLWCLFWLFKLATGKDGMGHGDFKLLALLGAWGGWQILPMTLLMASLLGVFAGLILLRLRKAQVSAPMPFGPCLAIAGWIALLWGGQITDFYLQSVGFR